MRRTCYLGFSFVLILALGAPAFSQQPAAAAGPQVKTQAEYNAYKAFYDEQNPQKKAELGEKFLAENKDSDYVPQAYQGTVGAYVRAQNWAKVMESADRAAALPKADNKMKAFVWANAMVAAQQTNNFDKIVEYGDKVLSIDPNDLNALIVLSSMLPERLPTDDAAKKTQLDKAANYADKALAGVQTVFSQPKPANQTDAQWAQQKGDIEGQLHSTLGFISLNRQDYPKSIEQYETALKSTPKDAIAHYRVGLAYQYLAAAGSKATLDAYNAENAAKAAHQDQALIDELVAKRQGIEMDFGEKRDKAIDHLAMAVAIGGVVGQPAHDALNKLYSTKNNGSTDGVDQLIAQKKSQLGTP